MKNYVSLKQLKIFYDELNERFFNNDLPKRATVKFSDMEEDGLCTCSEKLIEIHKDLQRHPDLMIVVLLHEMGHLKLSDDYVGMPTTASHGMRFQAELVRLFKAGAYDNVL